MRLSESSRESTWTLRTLTFPIESGKARRKGKKQLHINNVNSCINFIPICKPIFFFSRYVAWSGEFELVPGGEGDEKETPLQKYQRLNCEVRELLDDIQVLTQDKKKDDKGEVI